MTVKRVLTCWLAAIVAFVLGTYSAGAVWNLIHTSSVPGGAVQMIWLLDYLPLVMTIATSQLMFRWTLSTRWSHWLVIGLPVPIASRVIAILVLVSRGVEVRFSWGIVVYVAVSVVFSLGIGLSRMRWGQPGEAPEGRRFRATNYGSPLGGRQ
jgi:hypothetical protein